MQFLCETRQRIITGWMKVKRVSGREDGVRRNETRGGERKTREGRNMRAGSQAARIHIHDHPVNP